MKSKRAGYLRKGNQGNKKTDKNPAPALASPETEADKKNQPECSTGVCSISWKPAAVSR